MKGNLYLPGLQENTNEFEIGWHSGMFWCKQKFSCHRCCVEWWFLSPGSGSSAGSSCGKRKVGREEWCQSTRWPHYLLKRVIFTF